MNRLILFLSTYMVNSQSPNIYNEKTNNTAFHKSTQKTMFSDQMLLMIQDFVDYTLQKEEEFIEIDFRARKGKKPRKPVRKVKPKYFDIREIYGYGCYCNFGKTWKNSHGRPLNEIDRYCHITYQCKTCTQIDFYNEGESIDFCDPGLVGYEPPKKPNVEKFGAIDACAQMPLNKNLCQVRACACDVEFVDKLVKYMMDGKVFDSSKRHTDDFGEATDFDRKSECISMINMQPEFGQLQDMDSEHSNTDTRGDSVFIYDNGNNKHKGTQANKIQFKDTTQIDQDLDASFYSDESLPSPLILAQTTVATTTEKPKKPPKKICCGEYPNRLLYPDDGVMKCCGAKAFNSVLFECCVGMNGRQFPKPSC